MLTRPESVPGGGDLDVEGKDVVVEQMTLNYEEP